MSTPFRLLPLVLSIGFFSSASFAEQYQIRIPANVVLVNAGAQPGGASGNTGGSADPSPTETPPAEPVSVVLGPVSLPSVLVGAPYAYDLSSLLSISVSGYSLSDVNWSASNLPAGLSVTGGLLSGIPNASGVHSFTVSAAYQDGVGQQNYQIEVIEPVVTGLLRADTSANFGVVVVGQSATRTFTFANQGNTQATGLQASASGAGVTIESSSCGTSASPTTLAHGEQCSVTVRYAPTQTGAMTGALQVSWTGPVAASETINMDGQTIVDYSGLMSGYTQSAIPITKHAVWIDGIPWFWRTVDAQVSAPFGTFEFRRAVEIQGSSPAEVYLHGAIDDALEGIDVNGSAVAHTPGWNFLNHYSSTSFKLHPGINVISIRVRNGGANANPAGLAIEVRRNGDGALLGDSAGWKFQP